MVRSDLGLLGRVVRALRGFDQDERKEADDYQFAMGVGLIQVQRSKNNYGPVEVTSCCGVRILSTVSDGFTCHKPTVSQR